MSTRAVRRLLVSLALLTTTGTVARAVEALPKAVVEAIATETKPAFPEEVSAALEKAASSGRDVAVVFNVPDWGGWCERIRKDILEQPKFTGAAAKQFVVVNLDFPRKSTGSVDARRVKLAYAKRYRITGYPVVLLLDKTGRAYAKAGWREGGPAAYANHLAALKKAREKRDEQLEKARKNQGYIRAELAAGALGTIDAALVRDYADQFEELRAGDPQDRRGVIADYDITRLIDRVKDNVAESRNRASGLWEFDAYLAAHPDLPKAKRQRVLLSRFAYIPKSGEDGLSRIARCQKHIEDLRDMLELAPKSPFAKEIRVLIESEESQLAQLRNESTDIPE